MFVYAEEVEEDHEGPGGERMAAEDPGELSCQGPRVTAAPRGACTASSSSWSSNAGDGWSRGRGSDCACAVHDGRGHWTVVDGET